MGYENNEGVPVGTDELTDPEAIQTGVQQQTPAAPQGRMYTAAEVEEMKKNLYTKEQMQDIIKKRTGTKAVAQPMQQPTQPPAGYIKEEDAIMFTDKVLKQQERINAGNNVTATILEAAKEDPELESLIQKSKTGEIKEPDLQVLGSLKNIKNSPAIAKHLLSDPTDFQILQMAQTPMEKAIFFNNLSQRLTEQQVKNGGNKTYPTIPDIDGSAASSFSPTAKYIRR
jgi:hypothetical protein